MTFEVVVDVGILAGVPVGGGDSEDGKGWVVIRGYCLLVSLEESKKKNALIFKTMNEFYVYW